MLILHTFNLFGQCQAFETRKCMWGAEIARLERVRQIRVWLQGITSKDPPCQNYKVTPKPYICLWAISSGILLPYQRPTVSQKFFI